MVHTTCKEQFILLSSISNYHWIENVGLFTNKPFKSQNRYANHMIYFDPEDKGKSKSDKHHIPTSPRMCLMYMLLDDNYESSTHDLIKHFLHLDTMHEEVQPSENPEGCEEPPLKKRRKQTPRIVAVHPSSICKEIGVDYNAILNSAQGERSMYTQFQEEILVDGLIKWQFHSNTKDICVMSDINSSTGTLLPSSFVHVTSIVLEDDTRICMCTCDIYKIIQQAAHQQVPIWPEGEETLPDNSFTCMHCRFYNDFLMNAYTSLIHQNTGLTHALQKVQNSLQYMNNPVQLVGNVLNHATTKFSVQGDDSYSVVNFTFQQGNCYAKCTDGVCGVQMSNRGKIPKKVTIEQEDKVCSHLTTIHRNLQYITGFFPGYFTQDENSYEDTQDVYNIQGPNEEINTDDVNLDMEATSNFNKHTGLWNFKALSKHKPYANMMEFNLVHHTQTRNDYVNSQNFHLDFGVYRNAHLKPQAQGVDCTCGAGYRNQHYQYKGVTTLYTHNGPVELELYNLTCDVQECEVSFLHEAERRGIFFYSNKTCAGDEIGWILYVW